MSGWTLARLDAILATFLDRARYTLGHSADTCRYYKGAYQNFRRFLLLAVTTLDDPLPVTWTAIDPWLAWNRKRGLAPTSLRTYWGALRSIFDELARLHGIASPFVDAKAPPVPRLVPKARSFDDCQRILYAAEHAPWRTGFEQARAVAVLATFLYTGLRRGEVLRLGLNDVNLMAGTLLVQRGKGTGGGKDRTVYLAPELRPVLARYLAERRRLGLTGPEFFLSPTTNRGVSLSTLRRLAATVRRVSDIPFTLHSLRHSFVSHLLQAGAPLHVVSALAGHSQLTTTARYLGVWADDQRREIQKLSFR